MFRGVETIFFIRFYASTQVFSALLLRCKFCFGANVRFNCPNWYVLPIKKSVEQDCSYQGKALNVQKAF